MHTESISIPVLHMVRYVAKTAFHCDYGNTNYRGASVSLVLYQENSLKLMPPFKTENLLEVDVAPSQYVTLADSSIDILEFWS
jgi:hypothetical protein